VFEPTGIVGIFRKYIRPRLIRHPGMIDVHEIDKAARD
jgi:hypothetical protein